MLVQHVMKTCQRHCFSLSPTFISISNFLHYRIFLGHIYFFSLHVNSVKIDKNFDFELRRFL